MDYAKIFGALYPDMGGAKADPPKKFVAGRDIHWLQAFVGGSANGGVSKNYLLFSIPKIFLAGPDGKLISCYLRGPKIKQAVASALAR